MEIINNKLAMLNGHNPLRSNPGNPLRMCTHCKKREPLNALPDQKLKRCSRCRNRLYCSRACQRVDWKGGHQRTCRPKSISMSTNSSSNNNNDINIININNCYLDSLLSEEEAMNQLIDAYRLRVEDEKTYRGYLRGRYAKEEGDKDSLQSSLRDFQKFMDLAEASSSTNQPTDNDANADTSTNTNTENLVNCGSKSILPRWWNMQKRVYCEARAVQSDTWSTLCKPVSKDDIVKHYQDSTMPMKLRMLAEVVYGYNVMDQSRQ